MYLHRFSVDILFSKHVWNPVTIKRKLTQEAEIDLSGILLYSFPFQKCLYPQRQLLVPSTGDVVLSPFMYTALPSDLTRRREPLQRWHSWIFSFCNITDKVDKKNQDWETWSLCCEGYLSNSLLFLIFSSWTLEKHLQ